MLKLCDKHFHPFNFAGKKKPDLIQWMNNMAINKI